MKTIRSWFIPNPILVKELRSRMRGPRAFITLTIALVIMAGLMIGLVSLITSLSGQVGSNLLSPQIGQILFAALLIFEMLLVCTVTPAVTAGAISTEREKQTFEMLQATPLGSVRLLWGKLISALSYVFLLIFAAVPLASIVFLFGGVAIMQLLKGLLVLVVVAINLGVYGLFLSAWLGRTGRATVVGFVSVMALIAGPLLGMIVMGIFGGRIMIPRALLAVSPISMLSSAIATSSSTSAGGVDSVLNFIAGQWDPSMDPSALTQFPRPVYHYSLLICGVMTIVLFILTAALLHPSRRFFLPMRVGITGGAVLLAFLGLMAAAFLFTAPHYEWVKGTASTVDMLISVPEVRAVVPAQPVMANPAVDTATPVDPPAASGEGAGSTPTPEVPAASPTPTLTTGQGVDLPLEDQIAIYTAAARQVYLKDSTYGEGAGRFAVAYLLAVTNDRVGDLTQPDSDPVSLSPDLQEGVAASLGDLGARIVWVDTRDAVPLDPKNGMVQDGGIVIAFGNIRIQTDGRVQLPASAYVANMAAGGQTYVIEKTAGEWQVTGNTGVQWIS